MSRRRYNPANGLTRCPLCREMDDDNHVRHPRAQILAWLWASSLAWRTIICCLAIIAAVVLALLLGLVRVHLLGF